MSDNLPWKTWTPDDLAPPQAVFVPMVEPEESIPEEADPNLEQQLAQLQMQAHEQGYQAGITEKVASKATNKAIRKGSLRGWNKDWRKQNPSKRRFMPGCSNWSANFKPRLMRLIV